MSLVKDTDNVSVATTVSNLCGRPLGVKQKAQLGALSKFKCLCFRK